MKIWEYRGEIREGSCESLGCTRQKSHYTNQDLTRQMFRWCKAYIILQVRKLKALEDFRVYKSKLGFTGSESIGVTEDSGEYSGLNPYKSLEDLRSRWDLSL